MTAVKTEAECSWSSPSNIALVKYWGKKGYQLPANPSISFTLDQALTQTKVKSTHDPANAGLVTFLFEEKPNEAFKIRLDNYLRLAGEKFTWLKDFKLEIESSNTFPHSSGIASSASAYSALALCLCSLHEEITGHPLKDFYLVASYWARVGSGSACRSVYGGYNLWGKTEFYEGSDDTFAVNISDKVHPDLRNFSDTILIVEKGSKEISSSKGHKLLEKHPFAAQRFEEAGRNTGRMLDILTSGDLKAMTELVESEALMLHAMMLSSPSPFILMKPGSLAIIEKILDFRKQTGVNLMFTLDAGANVHILNPSGSDADVQGFIKNELLGYCHDGLYFCNRIGTGPVRTK